MTHRTTLGQLDRLRARRALLQHDTHHLGDHIPGAAHYHGVADPHVLAMHLVDVVERHAAHRHTADEYRLEACHGCQCASATDLEADVLHDGERFIRRELVRNRPARGARDKPEPLLSAAGVELVHHAIDLVGQRAAPLTDIAVIREATLDAAHRARLRRHRYSLG